MKVNKKALYALAAYYSHTNLESVASREERWALARLIEPTILEPYVEFELKKNILHAECFFKKCSGDIYSDEPYTNKFNDRNIAKLLRYIAKNGKFPKHRSLRYV